MKKLKGAIFSQNQTRSQWVAQGTWAPSVEMPPATKVCQKSLFLQFQFLLASLCTTVHVYNGK